MPDSAIFNLFVKILSIIVAVSGVTRVGRKIVGIKLNENIVSKKSVDGIWSEFIKFMLKSPIIIPSFFSLLIFSSKTVIDSLNLVTSVSGGR